MSELAQRRVKDFQQRCGATALHLAYHAALPVALNADLLHFLRINFFLDPPEPLPYTIEFEFLLSPLCREIDEGLYEIEPEIRDILLAGLAQQYDEERIRDVATLLWQYVDQFSAWSDRVELERAQQLTVLNFLAPAKVQEWLSLVKLDISQKGVTEQEWFVAMRQDIDKRFQQQSCKVVTEETVDEISTSVAILRFGETSEKWVLQNGLMRVGMSSENDVVLPNLPGVSRKHAEIFRRVYSYSNYEQSAYFLRDFSRYGTWVLMYGEWEKVHNREVFLQSETKIKFGGSKNPALDFLISNNAKSLEQQEQALSGDRTDLIEIYISYSRKDEDLKEELLSHLDVLKSERIISIWHDGMISPGSDWASEIDRKLSSARIILLLVSSDSLSSEFIQGVEIVRAMQRHEAGEVLVIPIILRQCDWMNTPFAKFQPLPRNARPVAEARDRNVVFEAITQEIRQVVKQISSHNRRVFVDPSDIFISRVEMQDLESSYLQERYINTSRKLRTLEREYVSENDPSQRIKLQQVITETGVELEKLQNALAELERRSRPSS